MAVFTVRITDGTTLANLAVAAGRGPKGDGFTGGSFNASTGIVTFTSNDGLGFATGDLRSNLSEPSPIGDVTPNTGAFTSLSTTGNTIIGGNLTVNGTTTTVNSQTLDVVDKNITVAFGSVDAASADGAGLTVDGANATLTYVAAGDKWSLNKPLDVTGNIALTGTVDGRDVAADGSKLDGIEAGATADQTAAEIKAAYESNANTNAFTDAEQSKLADIEALADVTDTANVTAAGALMDSEVTNLAAVKVFDPTDYATSAQGDLADSALQDGDTVASLAITSADINGGTIDGTVIGGSTPAAISGTTGSFSSVTATEGTFSRLNVGADLQWNSSTDSYTANSTPTTVTKIHQGMKRCVLNDDGSVNYYLDPADSTEKLDGTSANLDGTDGNVMVEIPRFYFRQVRNGNTLEWQISDVPLAGYQLHPAFFKDGEIVDFRYMGAYDACVYDDSASAYIAGLNLQDNTSNVDTANDKLASVSGIFPMVGLTRDENRLLAANNGTGWRQQDFWITSAVQLLYLIEYGDFNSQSYLGAGNTNGSYLASSADQNDSPNTIAGASNSLGNASTNTTTGAGVSAKPGTSFMSYRGIENFFGNVNNWVDGFNILADHQAFVTNNRADFADNTSSGFELLGTLHNVNGFVTNILDVPGAFLPSAVGGSSSTFLADNYFQNTGNRVARFGGVAAVGASAGAFLWSGSASSSSAYRDVGARLSF